MKEIIEYEGGKVVELDGDDAPELSEEWFAGAKKGFCQLPTEARNAVNNAMRGRPISDNPKKKVTIRLDADLLMTLRSSGKGWQTRINNVLREWVNERPQG